MVPCNYTMRMWNVESCNTWQKKKKTHDYLTFWPFEQPLKNVSGWSCSHEDHMWKTSMCSLVNNHRGSMIYDKKITWKLCQKHAFKHMGLWSFKKLIRSHFLQPLLRCTTYKIGNDHRNCDGTTSINLAPSSLLIDKVLRQRKRYFINRLWLRAIFCH